MTDPSPSTTYLFSDIEGSTRLWETEPERMKPALARHDQLTRAAVERHRGAVVKMTGDGVHAAFDDPLDALMAMLEIQLGLAGENEPPLRLRCGLHRGRDERRDGDFFGPAVNRAARIMSAANGGQMLLSHAVAESISGRLPSGISLLDLGQVRLRDLTRPERIFQVVDARFRTQFPALRSLESTPNNLPQQVNSFIGRERELVEARDLLQGSRLLTLLGMGGIGKSRLSMQLAADMLDDYPDGVWFVELAPLQDARLVAQELAAVLGVKEEAGVPIADTVANFVRDRQLLVVLDNCEHLIDASAAIARRLLQAGPRTTILATSRDPLRTAGEVVYHVPTLAIPDRAKRMSVGDLARLEAVRLFVDRASAAQPSFALNPANASAVSEICQRLDGIPLAIELAAARARAMSVEAIAARLSDRFRLLTSGDRTALPRQRTLRALIDWSYDLLSEQERALFRRLSVFAGGWTLEGAEFVGAGDGIERDEVLDLMAQLVEKSLVVMEASGARYRMLDTVRHYAQEKLASMQDEVPARRRHRDFFLALAENLKWRRYADADQRAQWLARADQERENFLAAHAFGDRTNEDPMLGVRLVDALGSYWISRGLTALGLRVAEEVLSRAALADRTQARCEALFRAGQLDYFMGRHTEAIDCLAEALAIARERDDRKWIGFILQPLGMACLGEGAVAAARGHLEAAYRLANELGNRRETATAANALAMVHRAEGQPGLAAPLYAQVIATARDLGDRELLAIGLVNQAMVSIELGSQADAIAQLGDVLDVCAEIGAKLAGQSALDVCAAIASAQGDWPFVARLYGIAQEQIRSTGLQRDTVDEAFLAPWIERARGALTDARFAALQAEGARSSLDDGLVEARAWLKPALSRPAALAISARSSPRDRA